MGNCVLVRRDQKSDSKFKWSVGSEPNKAIVWEKEIGRICSSPINHVASSSPEFSKGDEMFFDSQAWLDSDNEDFFSVNGDNTPSRCSTPIWRPNATETVAAEPSRKDGMKQLIDLFRESFNSEQERRSSIENTTNNHQIELVKMEANNNKQPSRGSGKSVQSTPCCISVPKLARSLSLSEKKKRLLSPCRGGGRVHL